MIETNVKSSFPSQVATDTEKNSMKYGEMVGQAIEQEWFRRDSGANRFYANRDAFHKLRLYARGEQSIKKYKDELAVNGDVSYLNLDWKPVPVIAKFVDIVVNGMSNRGYELKAYSQDPGSMQKKSAYMMSLLKDMYAKPLNDLVEKEFGQSILANPKEQVPESEEELDLHMQLSYKQEIEIAQEEALSTVFDNNKYELTKRRLDYDLTVLGIAAVKNSFNKAEGITIRYVDPADIVYSYTESPYFDDIYYVGEVKSVPINELKKQYPELTLEDLEEITKYTGASNERYKSEYNPDSSLDANSVSVLYFEYKTFQDQVFKIKRTPTGGEKAIEKDPSFNPQGENEFFEKVSRTIEVIYTGAKILGQPKMLEWRLAKNMVRPKADTNKVEMSYNIVAPRMYKGKIESLVGRMTTFADMIQLTHLKLQQVLSRIVPDGVYLDVDGLMEIDLGNGTNYNPAEALNMYFQTGSVVGRSMTQDGELNHGKMPITELSSNGGGTKINSLITTYNYYLQMIRDVTGLNEARDGSMPDRDALVGLQKMAAANSNTATRHILQSSSYLTLKTAECIALRISDVLEFSPTRESFINSIGKFNIGSLQDIQHLYLHDFGIFLELSPDEEEKQMLENNIQISLQQGQVDLEDAIDIRNIKNTKLANQLLKLKRKKKNDKMQQQEQAKIQAQAEAQNSSVQAAAQAEMMKQTAIAESKVKLAEAQTTYDIKKLEKEAAIKKELMQYEFDLAMKIKQMELDILNSKDKYKEDRKDERTKLQATQQSRLIDQRKNNGSPQDFKQEQQTFEDMFSPPAQPESQQPPQLPDMNFESSGNDVLGGFGTGQFEPK
jgi:hypothetical protein